MPIILLHLFVCTFPLSGRCHHSTPHLLSLSLRQPVCVRIKRNENRRALRGVKSSQPTCQIPLYYKSKSRMKKTENQKEKKTEKKKNEKRKYKTGTRSHSKRRQQALTATPFQFRFGFIPFNTHSGHCTPCGRRLDWWEEEGGRHFFHLYTREITQKLSKHCRCAAGLIENDSGS